MPRRLGIVRAGLVAVILVAAGAGCFASSRDTSSQPDLDGSFARALVWSAPYTDLVVEVDYLHNAVPSNAALTELVAILEDQTAKRSVTILPLEPITDPAVRRASETWTIEEVDAAQRRVFTSEVDASGYANGSTLYFHVIYLDSALDYDYLGKRTRAIGVSLGHAVVVFVSGDFVTVTGQRVLQDPAPETTAADRDVLLHEAGHAMGLLNLGAPMVRAHALPDDPYHSRNGESIMYAGTDLIGGFERSVSSLTKSGSARFDDDDLADLAALRDLESSDG